MELLQDGFSQLILDLLPPSLFQDASSVPLDPVIEIPREQHFLYSTSRAGRPDVKIAVNLRNLNPEEEYDVFFKCEADSKKDRELRGITGFRDTAVYYNLEKEKSSGKKLVLVVVYLYQKTTLVTLLTIIIE